MIILNFKYFVVNCIKLEVLSDYKSKFSLKAKGLVKTRAECQL